MKKNFGYAVYRCMKLHELTTFVYIKQHANMNCNIISNSRAIPEIKPTFSPHNIWILSSLTYVYKAYYYRAQKHNIKTKVVSKWNIQLTRNQARLSPLFMEMNSLERNRKSPYKLWLLALVFNEGCHFFSFNKIFRI